MIIGKRQRFSLRCTLGLHIHQDVEMDVAMGWGLFGGPLVTFRWFCPRCGRRGVT